MLVKSEPFLQLQIQYGHKRQEISLNPFERLDIPLRLETDQEVRVFEPKTQYQGVSKVLAEAQIRFLSDF